MPSSTSLHHARVYSLPVGVVQATVWYSFQLRISLPTDISIAVVS